MKPKNADPETLALQALAFLAADYDRVAHFLGSTSLGPDTLR